MKSDKRRGMDVCGPRVLVTAGASGIGRAIAVLHLDARHPEDGSPTPSPAIFDRFGPRTAATTDAIINITTWKNAWEKSSVEGCEALIFRNTFADIGPILRLLEEPPLEIATAEEAGASLAPKGADKVSFNG